MWLPISSAFCSLKLTQIVILAPKCFPLTLTPGPCLFPYDSDEANDKTFQIETEHKF